VTRGAGLLLTAFALYVVAPSLLALLDAVPSLGDVDPAWFLVVAGAEVASFACLWALLRIALRTEAWFIIVVSQLAGNAASRVLPGGPAAESGRVSLGQVPRGRDRWSTARGAGPQVRANPGADPCGAGRERTSAEGTWTRPPSPREEG